MEDDFDAVTTGQAPATDYSGLFDSLLGGALNLATAAANVKTAFDSDQTTQTQQQAAARAARAAGPWYQQPVVWAVGAGALVLGLLVFLFTRRKAA